MKFAIITHVIHKKHGHQYLAYAPYVREMNVWGKYVEEVLIVAPLQTMETTAVDSAYQHTNIRFLEVPTIHLKGVAAQRHAFLNVPSVLFQIYKAMSQADHIHLRCPGNMGLLGCLVQLVFPHKPKTAKYAGNWDPNAKQPWSYRFQKWLLSNTFLTRNMQVLAYGEWEGSTKNMHPFFTASYSEIEKQPLQEIALQGTLRFVFVGTLSKGKQPLYAIQLVEALFKKGYAVSLALYGEGAERPILEAYILANTLATMISLKGNQDQETVTQAYQNSHFVVLPSQSEGWPKALAEGMFWGCVPIATPVSCIPFMLDDGERGVLLDMQLEQDVPQLLAILEDEGAYLKKRTQACEWSRQYTLDVFEKEIKNIVL